MGSIKTAVFLVVLVAVAYSIETANALPVIAAEDLAVAAAPVSAVDAAAAPVASDLDVAEHKKKKYRGGGGSSEEGR
ncbi:hypothetical protein GHT06_022084 [Daphnia sinensis]|uniref:Uncharacterized protein n=1 Tax=Daphnia sinensis TaxID=1820382 RepID=A0AAD5L650_9CRUS|nr:hypothetical protein GHT06_022084 [Daphnia sinensis]